MPEMSVTPARWAWRGIGVLLAGSLGCAAGVPPVESAADAVPSSAQTRSCAAPASPPTALELRVRPQPDEAAVAVSLVIAAPEAELETLRPPARLRQPLPVRLTLERPGCDPVTGTQRVERREVRAEPGAPLRLGGAASTEPITLRLEYRLDGATSPLLLNDTRFMAEGRQLFFLPASRAQTSAPTRVAIDASAYGSDGRAVSSIGLGAERRAVMTHAAIDDAVFAAGYLGSAVFDAAEGKDEAAWFGSPLFDPRPLAAEIASFRSAVRERLRDRYEVTLTLILGVEAGLSAFDVQRTPASVVVRVAPGQTLSAQLRLSILHQVLKEWIGGRLTLIDGGGVAVWFTEGSCRYLARQLALEFGLISPLEYLEELNGLLAIQSVLGQRAHGAACAAEAASPGGPFSGCQNLLGLARGALLAGELDRVLAARGTSFTALLAGWLREAQVPLTPSTWAAALQREGGEPAAALLASFARGDAIVPPSSAFGPCFARAPSRLAESELGFEYQSGAASAAGRWLVTRVPERSPAFAAGLRAETAIDAIEFAPYASERPVRLLAGDAPPLEYRPQTHARAGVAWKRVAGVPDQRCARP